MKPHQSVALETLTAQAVGANDSATRGVIPSILMSATYARDEKYTLEGDRDYSRDKSPAYLPVEELVTRLEGGHESLVFASGMAAATAVFQVLAPGDHVVVPKLFYWGLRNWLREFGAKWNVEVSFVDTTNLAEVAAALQPGKTRILWIETPANPGWDVTDIAACAKLAHDAGAMLAVDSTASTPVFTRPIALGADLVMHSATKYLNGHSDVVAGILTAKNADHAHWQALKYHRRHAGAVLGNMEAWLLLRGMRTLFPRVRQQAASAQKIAEHLQSDPRISAVLYPGLASHPGHLIAKAQMEGGFGGMLSLRIKAGKEAAIAAACKMQVFVRATSLGGVESLVEHRKSAEGASSPVPDDLLRLSVGIEHVSDLIADLDQAIS